jgi:hypothetical protein
MFELFIGRDLVQRRVKDQFETATERNVPDAEHKLRSLRRGGPVVVLRGFDSALSAARAAFAPRAFGGRSFTDQSNARDCR